MTVIVRIQWHFLSESLDISIKLETGIILGSLFSQLSIIFNWWLGNLMYLKNAWIFIEKSSQESTLHKCYFLNYSRVILGMSSTSFYLRVNSKECFTISPQKRVDSAPRVLSFWILVLYKEFLYSLKEA